MRSGLSLRALFHLLLDYYGPQNWWPVDEEYHMRKATDPRDEIIIGAVLTQNTSWKNVEKALENLKLYGELSLEYVRRTNIERLKELIRPTGFYNQKSEKLKSVASFIKPTEMVCKIKREELLAIKGVGKETSDAILLYAGGQPTFVVDKYTQRLVHRLYGIGGGYDEVKRMFEENLPKDLEVYREFHALIDEHAKRHCRGQPLCGDCPLRDFCVSADPYP